MFWDFGSGGPRMVLRWYHVTALFGPHTLVSTTPSQSGAQQAADALSKLVVFLGRCLGSRFAFAEAKAPPRVDVDETSQQLSAAADAQQKGSILIRDPESFQVFVHIGGSGARVLWVTPCTTLSDLCGSAGLDCVGNRCDVYATVGTRLLGWNQSVHSCGVVAGSRVDVRHVTYICCPGMTPDATLDDTCGRNLPPSLRTVQASGFTSTVFS